MDKNNIVLLIKCPDKKGLVQAVSNFIFENDGNIIDLQQHSLGADQEFFMRVYFDALEFKIPNEKLDSKFSDIAKKYDIDFSFHLRNKKKKMAILVSKYDHCLYDILLRQRYSELDTEIACIISNHPDLENIAKTFNIPFHYLPVEEDKAKQEEQIFSILDKEGIDLIALARYMQILSSKFITKYPHKIINVHHGFLPAFKGAKPYHQAYEKGVKVIGATAHYATEDLDMGPIIEQDVIRVNHRDEVPEYLAKGRDIEKLVFARALKAHIEDKIIVFKNRTIVFS